MGILRNILLTFNSVKSLCLLQDDISGLKSQLSDPSYKPECYGPFLSAAEPGEPVDNLWYPDAPTQITPYELGNLRNKVIFDDVI